MKDLDYQKTAQNSEQQNNIKQHLLRIMFSFFNIL